MGVAVICGRQLSSGRKGLPVGAKLLCTIAVADAVAVATTLACQSAGRGRGRSRHRSPRVRPCSGTCRYRCSCAILPPWPAAPPNLRPFQQAWSCTRMDGVKTSVARQTSCNVRTAGTAAIVVAVAVVVTIAAAVAVTVTVAGGHCTPPGACSRVRSCSRSCPLLRLPREPMGPRAQISAEL